MMRIAMRKARTAPNTMASLPMKSQNSIRNVLSDAVVQARRPDFLVEPVNSAFHLEPKVKTDAHSAPLVANQAWAIGCSIINHGPVVAIIFPPKKCDYDMDLPVIV